MPNELEQLGLQLLTDIGIPAIGAFRNVRLLDIDPRGTHRQEDSLELDYLVPYGETALIGEITGRSGDREISRKIEEYSTQLTLIQSVLARATDNNQRDQLFGSLGVPEERVREFRNCRTIRGFAFLTEKDRAEMPLTPRPNLTIMDAYDFLVLQEYRDAIGTYAAPSFLEPLGLLPLAPQDREDLVFRTEDSELLTVRSRHITLASGQEADVLLFDANPYKILPRCRVYRREHLSQPQWSSAKHYQRALSRDKLDIIRSKLTTHPFAQGFIFPGSILVVLGASCQYEETGSNGTLRIPNHFGALHVVDGQHRLYAYADNRIKTLIGDQARVLVTAIHLRGATDATVKRMGAQTFVEINSNQTRVSPLLMYDISYDLLGDRSPRAISAMALIEANRRTNDRLRGLLHTNDNPRGPIKMTELTSVLAQISKTDRISELRDATQGRALTHKNGYQNLFGCPIEELGPETLKDKLVVVLSRYFNALARRFAGDWQQIRRTNGSSAFRRTKMFAGWIYLLKSFLEEGLDWNEVEQELDKIKANVGHLEARNNPTVVFDESLESLPGVKNRQKEFFWFLSSNRSRRTRIQTVVRDHS